MGNKVSTTFDIIEVTRFTIMDEQLFWGRQLQRLNLAGKPLPAKTVTAAKLANELKKIITNRKLKQNAEQMSIAMLKQGGVKQAVKLIKMSIYD